MIVKLLKNKNKMTLKEMDELSEDGLYETE